MTLIGLESTKPPAQAPYFCSAGLSGERLVQQSTSMIISTPYLITAIATADQRTTIMKNDLN
jgi:hypothetical protein